MTFEFYLLDVFTETQFEGNPLAVVVNANSLDKVLKQKISAEMNFSETCYLNTAPEKNGGYALEIFTPTQEIAFAGHPILGAAKVLFDQYYSGADNTVLFNLKNANVKSRFEFNNNEVEIAWFDSPEISHGEIVPHETIAKIFNVDNNFFNLDFPIQEISASTSALILPFENYEQLHDFKVTPCHFKELESLGLPRLLYCFTKETLEQNNDFHVRFFFDSNGVREDPATGNGAAFFGSYLIEHAEIHHSRIVRIEQGYHLGHPSLILVQVGVVKGKNIINVGGSVVMNVKGELLM